MLSAVLRYASVSLGFPPFDFGPQRPKSVCNNLKKRCYQCAPIYAPACILSIGVDILELLLQIVMATFSYLYFNSYVARGTMAVGGVLTSVLQLGPEQQLELFGKLANILAGEELLPEKFVSDISDTLKARAVVQNSRLCNAVL